MMRKELDELLCKKYPRIFRDRHADMRSTAMCWGFECGDGWFNIIDRMCQNIQSHINHTRNDRARALRYNRAIKRANKGDVEGLIRYHNYRNTTEGRILAEKYTLQDIERGLNLRKVRDACPQVITTQVKEKFGTLRFYYDGGDDYIRGIVSLADSMSAVTCEECGSPGKLLTQGWHRTLCETHAKEQGYDHIEVNDE